MILRLSLTYILRRTCDGSDDGSFTWVGWCPELDIMSQGRGIANTLWMVREAARIRVENDVQMAHHPLRHTTDTTQDEDYPFYKQFIDRYMEEGDDDKWDHTYRVSQVPTHVDTCAVSISMDVETNAGTCLISDSWYGEIWFLAGQKKEVTALVEMTFQVPEHAQNDVRGYIESRYSHKVVEIK